MEGSVEKVSVMRETKSHPQPRPATYLWLYLSFPVCDVKVKILMQNVLEERRCCI